MSSPKFNAAVTPPSDAELKQLSYLLSSADADPRAFDGHNFEFLFSNKPKRDSKLNITQGLQEARLVQNQFKKEGVTADLTAKIWGPSDALQPVDIEKINPFETLTPNRNFQVPAEYIMNEARAGHSKNYIVVTDGNLYTGNLKEIALSLAFISLTPDASLDFVVPSNAPSGVDKLLEALKDTAAAKQVHVTKTPNDNYVSLAVRHVLKDRVTPPAPEALSAPPAPKKKKLFGIFPI